MSRLAGVTTHNQTVQSIPENSRQSASLRVAAAASASNQAADIARLSTTGGSVAQAVTGSDVRADKVAALQQAIASGTYNVSAADVADKLISNLLGGR